MYVNEYRATRICIEHPRFDETLLREFRGTSFQAWTGVTPPHDEKKKTGKLYDVQHLDIQYLRFPHVWWSLHM
jgi:hypothetical protein